MEKKILEIIQKHTYAVKSGGEMLIINEQHRDKLTKEIASHVMDFIEWMIHNTMEATTYSPLVYLKYQTKDEVIEHGGQFFDISKEWHIEELYEYWLNNIKK